MNKTPEEKLALCRTAITHALGAIIGDNEKYYRMGPLTGTWEKLTEAYAALYDQEAEEVRERLTDSIDEDRYNRFCQQHEADNELLQHCYENGITLEFLKELPKA